MYKYKAVKVNGVKVDQHRQVVEGLLGRRLRKDELVHHIDGDYRNNDPSNLVVVTYQEHYELHKDAIYAQLNTPEAKAKRSASIRAHRASNPSPYSKRVQQVDKDTGEIVAEYPSVKSTSKNGFEYKHVSACCQGRRKTHKGFVWRFAPVDK